MENVQEKQIVLWPHDEFELRLSKIRSEMEATSTEALLLTDNANIYYLTGRVFAGYAYIPLKGMPIFFVKRPVELEGDGIVYIRKPEEITASIGMSAPSNIALELDVLPYSMASRLIPVFPGAEIRNASPLMRTVRAVKTPLAMDMLRQSGAKHTRVYRRIPGLFQEGMSDYDLQVSIEHLSRLQGCLGQFRISGDTMELYMGNVLAGRNADAPSPYDFAMGGAGMDPSLPVGANGTLITPGTTVMVDINGNYNGYMTDMTRVFALGDLEPLAERAHQCSIDIHHALCDMMHPGTPAKALWEKAEQIVTEADLKPYYMGHRQHAGFIGHGVGIEINELPVIAPRSRDIIQEGNVIALEPKFVIPHVGAVGIENTYIVHSDHVECITLAPEEIIYFDR
ncbi:Xaa-Pro peptidase family protein [uncultured Duncaniella sp.]|uniref:M24 family metallopeptidase n=1 Tax=uncultured Duncaniella sp. TaxID=2768039 RepID=UPI0026767216|nr:Xaa-Pro peptidase family protein [uncultured Duncaniella sp.]MCI9172839.1 aminopeptidase P family protein [Muribaculaceae bacterium]